jgi:hypothetical protein
VVAEQQYKPDEGEGRERPNADHEAFGGFFVLVNQLVREPAKGLEGFFSFFAGGARGKCGEDSAKNGRVAKNLGWTGVPKGSDFKAEGAKKQGRHGDVHQNDVKVGRIHDSNLLNNEAGCLKIGSLAHGGLHGAVNVDFLGFGPYKNRQGER